MSIRIRPVHRRVRTGIKDRRSDVAAGAYISGSAIFITAAALCIPVVVAQLLNA